MDGQPKNIMLSATGHRVLWVIQFGMEGLTCPGAQLFHPKLRDKVFWRVPQHEGHIGNGSNRYLYNSLVSGALMLIAWMTTGSLGMMVARYLKGVTKGHNLWGKDVWFLVRLESFFSPAKGKFARKGILYIYAMISLPF